jgi:hypothetical protein
MNKAPAYVSAAMIMPLANVSEGPVAGKLLEPSDGVDFTGIDWPLLFAADVPDLSELEIVFGVVDFFEVSEDFDAVLVSV